MYIERISDRLQELHVTSVAQTEAFEKRQVAFLLEHARAACAKDNFVIAINKRMKQTRKQVRRLCDPNLTLQWTHTYAEIQQKRCLVSARLELEGRINTLSGVLSNLGTTLLLNHSALVHV